MTLLTDWITAIAALCTPLGGLWVYLNQKNAKLPLVEITAENHTKEGREPLVRINLEFTNVIPERLIITGLTVKRPRNLRLFEYQYGTDRSYASIKVISEKPQKAIDRQYEIDKPDADKLGVQKSLTFYTSSFPIDGTCVKIRFCITSSARTFSRKRLTVKARLNTT